MDSIPIPSATVSLFCMYVQKNVFKTPNHVTCNISLALWRTILSSMECQGSKNIDIYGRNPCQWLFD